MMEQTPFKYSENLAAGLKSEIPIIIDKIISLLETEPEKWTVNYGIFFDTITHTVGLSINSSIHTNSINISNIRNIIDVKELNRLYPYVQDVIKYHENMNIVNSLQDLKIIVNNTNV